jgi:hypothetical protein
VSEHFALAEFLHSDTAVQAGIENLPTWEDVIRLEQLAEVLEKIRALLGVPVVVSSGFRCPALNAAVGGVADSAHLHGLACDFTAPAYGSPHEVCKAIEPHLVELEIDQLIDEGGGGSGPGWVHLGLCESPDVPRCESFRIG